MSGTRGCPARIYGILKSTLRDRTLGLQPVGKENLPYTGPGPLFSKTEEDELVNHIRYMSSIGYGYSRQNFIRQATDCN